MSDKAIQLLRQDAETDIKNMTRQLMKLAPGGQTLTNNQAVQLAVAARLTNLNPFNGEIYMTPRGVMIGVAGVRRKALDMLVYESGETSNHFHTRFETAMPDEAEFDPDKGDIGYRCTLTDDVSLSKWIGIYSKLFTGFVQAGLVADVARQEAERLSGPRPEWTAVGVVKAEEQFGRDGKDAWDRHERAKKRAEKWALRKRFPTVIIDAEDIEISVSEQRIIQDVTAEVEAERLAREQTPGKSSGELLAELGYGEEPEPEAVDGEYSEEIPEGRWPNPEHIEILMSVGQYGHGRHAVNTLRQSAILTPTSSDETVRIWAEARRRAEDKGDENPTEYADQKVADLFVSQNQAAA